MDPLVRDQEFFAARMEADPYHVDITVLMQRKGVVEADIDMELGTLNEKASKIGAVVVVIKPTLVNPEPDAPGPEYFVEIAIQVFTEALYNNDATTGTQKEAEAIATRERQLFHRWSAGEGVFFFHRMEPIEAKPGQESFGVIFRRRAVDEDLPRCGTPLIDPDAGAVPQTVTLTTATAGAAIWYTTDGSYPSSDNDAATEYSAPFEIAAACTLLCAAEKTGMQGSSIAQSLFT